MKLSCLLFILSFCGNTHAQLTNQQVRDLKGGKVKTDHSFVYWLPFAINSKFLLIQGYNSSMSHKGEISIDFKMKEGSKICAARGGVVTATKADSDVGGLKEEYLNQGNHIIVKHDDGSEAMYWHLQKDGVVVNVGDIINQGQHIGNSGNTGYTAFPHLHFQVFDKDGKNIATRFLTKKGIGYLRPGKWYKSIL